MSTRVAGVVATLVLCLGLGAGTAAAQAWDAPAFFSPRPHDELGLYGFVPEHGDWGLQGIWRQSGNLNLGVRAGIGDGQVTVGAEFYGPLHLAASPVLLAWQLGFGAGFNDETLLRVPAGISIGMDLAAQNLPQLTPYVFPRLALEVAAWNEGGDERTETGLALALDVGADLTLTPELTLQGALTIADRSAFGVGIAYRMQRRILVR